MSKKIHLHDYVDLSGLTPQVARKFMNMSDLSIEVEKYPLELHTGAFHGQRIDGYMRGRKYILKGLFADPNTYD